MIFEGYLADYNSIFSVDPTLAVPDTYAIYEFARNANLHFLNGREINNDTLVANWNCSSSGNLNTVQIVDLSTNAAVQEERIYYNQAGLDSIYMIYLDTAGNGQLSLAQTFELYYPSGRLDSAKASDLTGLGIGGDILYRLHYDSNDQLDSLVMAINFNGIDFPIQVLHYFSGANGLDSAYRINGLTREVEERIVSLNNSNGETVELHFYELDGSNEWVIYDMVIFSSQTFFGKIERQNFIALYPNPAQEEIKISTGLIKTFSIHDLSGRLVEGAQLIDQQSINISALKSGHYFLNLEMNDGSEKQSRFVKQ